MQTHCDGILLCAGFGTRLKPLTDHVPKPAIDFMGHPMVWYAMNSLKSAGVTTLAANVHYLPDRMVECLEACAQDLSLPPVSIYREADGILGTGGGARACLSCIPDADRYIIHHGDVLCSVDLSEALKSHIASGCKVTLVVAPRPENSKLGMIGVSHDDQIVQIRDWCRPDLEPTKPACFTGIHIVERRFLETLAPGQNICLVTEIYRQMLTDSKPIHAFWTHGFFADIGTHETYAEARRDIQNHPGLLAGAVAE